ncbi:hypothetical protein CIB84_005921, partial [Bambusicola thoracicus]
MFSKKMEALMSVLQKIFEAETLQEVNYSSMERIQVENGTLIIPMLNMSDSGLYQCVAENKYDTIYASAELRVIAAAPDFSKNPVKKTSIVQVGGEVTIGCRPSASPRAAIDWRKGPEVLRLNK